jgi:hypothetical protein
VDLLEQEILKLRQEEADQKNKHALEEKVVKEKYELEKSELQSRLDRACDEIKELKG